MSKSKFDQVKEFLAIDSPMDVAVNVAAGVAAVVALRAGGKALPKIIAKRASVLQKGITPTRGGIVVYHAGNSVSPMSHISSHGKIGIRIPKSQGVGVTHKKYKPVHLREGNMNFHAGTRQAANERGNVMGSLSIDRYEIVNRKAIHKDVWPDEVDPSWLSRVDPNMRFSRLRVNIRKSRGVDKDQSVQFFDNRPTPEGKVIRYDNAGEGIRRRRDGINLQSTAHLIPKELVKSGDVVYRGSTRFGFNSPWTSPRIERLERVRRVLPKLVNTATPYTGLIGGVAPMVMRRNAKG